ncbi:MAG: SLC13 family permease [Bacillota bacterium]
MSSANPSVQEPSKVQKAQPEWMSGVSNKQVLGLILAFAVLFIMHYAPTLPGLKPQGQSVLAIFLWFMIILLFDAMHKFVVGLAAPMFVVLIGGEKIPAAFSAFSSDAFFLAIGAFTYAAIMMATPLGKRIAIGITDLFRSVKVPKIFFGLSAADFGISGFLPTVAETALFLPIAKGISGLMDGKEHLPEVKRINNGLFLLICGLMPLFTSLLVLTAHFPNIMLAGYLKDSKGIYVSWMDWIILNLPLWGLLPIVFIYTVWYFKLWKAEIPGAAEEFPKMKESLGRITWPEKWALGCLAVTLFLWISEKYLHSIPTGMVALIMVLLIFLPFGQIKFNKVFPHMMWDVWVLLGGSVSLGTALHKSGALEWMTKLLLSPMSGAFKVLPAVLVLGIIAFILHIPRAGIVSAAAMGAMFIPLTMTMAGELGFNVLPFTLIITNALSCSFFLPMSITAFFIAWGASGMTMGEVVRFGIPLSIITNIYTIISMSIWLPLIGHPLMM